VKERVCKVKERVCKVKEREREREREKYTELKHLILSRRYDSITIQRWIRGDFPLLSNRRI